MVKIRLMRLGKKNDPFYRIVATDSQNKRGGKFIKILGFYSPREKVKNLKKKEIEKFVSLGAVLSPAVQNLMK
ncbi:MAG: 30S ribosomal protein S16 [Candidatus Woesebacteria bacterium]|nr:MAG: 30S ribosomal protein S16 [Candidatus Woesebacteria bacterium]